MDFLDKKKNEEWIDGTPESFKIWFWIRLAVCLFLLYTGGELIYRYVRGEIGWGAIAGAAVFFVFGVVFLIWDVSRYVRLRRTMKQRDEAPSEDDSDRPTSASSPGPGPSLSRALARDAGGRTEGTDQTDQADRPSGISGFAKYVVDDDKTDEEDEGDDEI